MLYLSVAIFIVCFVYYFITRHFNYWKDKNVKGPKPIPFFGNFLDVALRKQHMGMFFKDAYRQFPDEKVVGLYRMTAPCLLIRDLDVVKEILFKESETFSDRGTYYAKDGLSQNLFHSDADTWRMLRNRLTSVFTSTKLKSLFYLLSEGSDKFIDYIETVNLNERELDIYGLFLKYSVSSTMSAIFGLDIDVYCKENICDEVDSYFRVTYDREIEMLFPGILKKLNRSIITKGAIKFSHEVIQAGMQQLSDVQTEMLNIMDVFKNLKKEGSIYRNKTSSGGKEPFMEVNDKLLAAQVWIFYFAGYGNSSLTFAYAMYHLARNPEVQDKLREEIDDAMEKNAGNITYEVLKDLKYLGMVFEETLRMHPTTNAVSRRAHKDIKLESLDFTIDNQTDLLISPYAIQRDEKNFPEPERFNPERFLPENVRDRHPCAFLSFGAGRRSCLGSRFAYLQFGVCVAKVIHKYRVETTRNTINEIQYDSLQLLLTPQPQHRIYLKLVPRQT